jgi:RecA/RadA recombinase
MSDDIERIGNVIVKRGTYVRCPVTRFDTGIHSLNWALRDSTTGDIGGAYRSIYEIYGRPGVGKSTFAYWLASRVNPTGTVLICDLESVDVDHIARCVGSNRNFVGSIEMIDHLDPKTNKMLFHDQMLTNAYFSLIRRDDITALVIDSVGAILPRVESEADIGEAIMGKRARIVSTLSKDINFILRGRETLASAFLTNHSHQVIGGFGTDTAGGVVLTYMAGTRISLWHKKVIKKGDDVLAFVIGGNVEKLKFGLRGYKFQVINLPGYGINANLSAVFDCIEYGLVTHSKGGYIKIGDKNYGRLSDLIGDADDDEKFQPFYGLLVDYRPSDEVKVREDAAGSDFEWNESDGSDSTASEQLS